MVIKKICVIGVTKVYVNTITVSKWNVFRRRCCCEKSVSDFSHCSESAMQRFIQCKFNCRLVQQHGCCLWLESEPKDDLFLMLQFRLFFSLLHYLLIYWTSFQFCLNTVIEVGGVTCHSATMLSAVTWSQRGDWDVCLWWCNAVCTAMAHKQPLCCDLRRAGPSDHLVLFLGF